MINDNSFEITEQSNGDTRGTISWQFDLSDPTLQIKKVQIVVGRSTFHSSASIVTTLTDNLGNVHKLCGS